MDKRGNSRDYRTWLTRSMDFKDPGEHKLAFERIMSRSAAILALRPGYDLGKKG